MSKLNNIKDERNLTMLMDFYELTMSNGYFKEGFKDKVVVFDMFYRANPDHGGYAIVAGLEQLIDYIENMHFDKDDIAYLNSKNIFYKDFIEYLANFKFRGDIFAIPEGTPVFPNEPLVTIKAPIIEAQLIETMLLLTINHQSLIATKASRIIRAASGRVVMEFGSRRAQGFDAATYGARAAYIGGVPFTANVTADKLFSVPAIGTMAHSWIQLFDTEYEAFKVYATNYPDDCTLLIDTYNVMKSGLINAIKVANEVLIPMGKRLKGIRLDSGDLAYLSKKVRKSLDEANLQDCKICVSNSLDEYLIKSLLEQGAKIDSFGIGERLITAKSDPVFGGVYKLAAVEKNNIMEPRIKVSENDEKITNPGYKKLYRIYDNNSGLAIADYITLADEVIDPKQPLLLFNPRSIWKQTLVENYTIRELQEPIYIKGKLVYKTIALKDIQSYAKQQLETLYPETLRFENPHQHFVDLSKKLYDLKIKMINDKR
ncbi:MAG: nicotinate phosphoribosyltransferase [Erysipelotrichaceae bacterium]